MNIEMNTLQILTFVYNMCNKLLTVHCAAIFALMQAYIQQMALLAYVAVAATSTGNYKNSLPLVMRLQPPDIILHN